MFLSTRLPFEKLFVLLVACDEASALHERWANASSPNATSSSSGSGVVRVPNSITSKPTMTRSPTMNISSCDPKASFNLTDYLVPSLRNLPASEFWPLYWEEHTKILNLQTSFNWLLSASHSNTAGFQEEYTSLYWSVQSAASSVWDWYGGSYRDIRNMGLKNGCQYKTCRSQYLSKSSSFASAHPNELFWWSVDPPCCGQCSIYGDGVEVDYWPTPAVTPPITKILGTRDGWHRNEIRTYFSPSVYATFNNMYAADLCTYLPYDNHTFWDLRSSWEPDGLSTFVSDTSIQSAFVATANWRVINYEDFGPNCTCTPPNCEYDSILGEWRTNICTPGLSIPPFVTRVIPAWSGCAANFYGVFDPPFALTSQSGLVLPKSTSVLQTSSSTPTTSTSTQSAQPNVLPHSPGPAQTSTTTTLPPASSGPPPPQRATSTSSGATLTLLPPPGGPIQPPSSITPSPAPSSTGAHTAPLPPGGITTTIWPSIIVNGQTITANPQGSFIIGTSTASLNADGNLVIGDQTITVGGQAVTVSGEIISLAAGATEVIYRGTSTTNLGNIILSFLGRGSTTPTTGTTTETSVMPVQFMADAASGQEWLLIKVIMGFALSIGIWLL